LDGHRGDHGGERGGAGESRNDDQTTTVHDDLLCGTSTRIPLIKSG
jgi:hypothetical protein